jgi:DNA primase
MQCDSNNGRNDMSLAALVGETVSLERHASGLRGACPLHSDPSRSLYVSTVLDCFHCFGCGRSGDAVKWIMIRDRRDRETAEAILEVWQKGKGLGRL